MLVRDHKEAMSDMVGVVLMRKRRMVDRGVDVCCRGAVEREDVDQESRVDLNK